MMTDTVSTTGLCALIDDHLRVLADVDGVDFDEALRRGQRYGVGRVAAAAQMSERALWRLYHERDRVDVYTADRLLGAIGRRLGELPDYDGVGYSPWAIGLADDMLTVQGGWEFR